MASAIKKLDKLLKKSRFVPEVPTAPNLEAKEKSTDKAVNCLEKKSEPESQKKQEVNQQMNGHAASSSSSGTVSNHFHLGSSLPNRPEVRTKRLMKEFMHVSQNNESNNTYTVELVEDSLYEWNVKLFKIDPDSALSIDMNETGYSHILLNIIFPDKFPFAPPFMRVVYPRIEGGFVLEGGAICMELLTPSGWSSAYTVEAMIMQFSALVVKGKGRINKRCRNIFTRKEAESTFKKLVRTHEKYGWVTPPQSEG